MLPVRIKIRQRNWLSPAGFADLALYSAAALSPWLAGMPPVWALALSAAFVAQVWRSLSGCKRAAFSLTLGPGETLKLRRGNETRTAELVRPGLVFRRHVDFVLVHAAGRERLRLWASDLEEPAQFKFIRRRLLCGSVW